MLGRLAALCCCILALLLASARPAYAWIENHVGADEVRLELGASGKALVEHRITLRTTGSERLRELVLRGVDPDAMPAGNSYVVPESDALSSSLESATPLKLEVRHPARHGRGSPGPGADGAEAPPPIELVARVDAETGLKRGTFVFVLRYTTDLRARGLLRRQGPLVEIAWSGLVWEDGLDNARTTFVVPAAPTPPRAVDETPDGADERAAGKAAPDDGDESTAPGHYLSEVRRGTESDEIELMRSYVPRGTALPWVVRVDQRALEPLSEPEAVAPPPAPAPVLGSTPPPRQLLLAAAAGLWLLYTLLVAFKALEVKRHAREARATVRPAFPLPLVLRAPAAGLALAGGVALQLVLDRPLLGAAAVVLATVLAAHGAARPDPRAAKRGPGRWLTVSEVEALALPPRPRGALLDVSTRAGQCLLLLLGLAVGAGAAMLWPRAPHQAVLIALDVVALLGVFGTGRLTALPPDLSIEPIRFLRKLVGRMRRAKGAVGLRIAPRIRIPAGALDPDELRLLVVPRMPLRGFAGIEVALSYALGLGARVGMPEVLLRVIGDSPCEEAIRSLAALGRVTPGRRADERVLTLAPRLPSVRMTAEIVLALAARVSDRASAAPIVELPAEPRPATRRARKAPRDKRREPVAA
jgi:hypothetical protein